jgi:hypothetical protein
MTGIHQYLTFTLILGGYSVLLPLIFYFYFVRTYLKVKKVASAASGMK